MKITVPVLILMAACSGPEPAPPAGNGSGGPAVPLSARQGAGALPKPSLVASPSLIPGDQIEIKVYQQPDLDLVIRIPPNGTITCPLIGPVDPVGRTTTALETVIRERLGRDFLHDPSVTVIVREYAPRTVYVHGGVVKPGAYPMPPSHSFTLLQLIATAGGCSDRAFKEYTQILRRTDKGDRRSNSFSLIEVEKAVARGNAEADVLLQPDDLVIIPSAPRTVYVVDQVKAPGAIEIPADARFTVMMAITRAGGWTKFAATDRVKILRQPPTGDPVTMEVDLDAIQEGRLERDVELQPGDIISVPARGLFK